MEFKLDEQQETEIKTYVLNVVKDWVTYNIGLLIIYVKGTFVHGKYNT